MKNLISRTFYAIGIALFFFSVQPAFSQQFSQIIAFGDSLVDVGNVAGLTEPGVSPVINGYYEETHFSDNIIWVETLANYLGLPARTPGRGNSTTLTPLPDGNTWAWGGSEAAIGSVQPPGVIEPIPNLLKEVTQYLEANVPNEDTLYTIWSGADNLLIGGQYGPEAAQKAVKAVKLAMQRLENAGARNILVFNLPKLGSTPSAQAGGVIVELAADIYAEAYNKALSKTVKKLRKDRYFQAQLYLVDIYSEFLRVINTVDRGGTYIPKFFVPGPPVAISNVTNEGLIFFQTFGTFPTDYLFWDGVHPTTQAHQVVAGLVLKTLQASQHHLNSSSSSD
jgi:phospholipase/lecithinase/hemolysin